jgi:hypothetical protein
VDEVGSDFVALLFVFHFTEKSAHRIMAAASQPKEPLGRPKLSRFQLTLRKLDKNEARPEIRSDEFIAKCSSRLASHHIHLQL